MTLSCDIKGYPTPVYSWVKNKTVVSTGLSSLTLRHLKQNNSGTYECWGNNSLGYDAKLVKLVVASKYTALLNNCNQNKSQRSFQYTAKNGLKVVAFCQPFANKLQQTCQFHLVAKSLLKSGLSQIRAYFKEYSILHT